MEAIGLLVMLEARAGKEADAEAFLKSAQPLALDEKATLKWYAIKLGPGKFGIFDTFANEAGRNAHLTGEIANFPGPSLIAYHFKVAFSSSASGWADFRNASASASLPGRASSMTNNPIASIE